MHEQKKANKARLKYIEVDHIVGKGNAKRSIILGAEVRLGRVNSRVFCIQIIILIESDIITVVYIEYIKSIVAKKRLLFRRYYVLRRETLQKYLQCKKYVSFLKSKPMQKYEQRIYEEGIINNFVYSYTLSII